MYSKVTVFMNESMSRLSPILVMQREMLPLLLLFMHTVLSPKTRGKRDLEGPPGAPLQAGPLVVKVHQAA